jgi:predicted secreted protein
MNRDQERNVSLDHKETLYLKENPSIAGFIWPPTINKPIAIPQVLD